MQYSARIGDFYQRRNPGNSRNSENDNKKPMGQDDCTNYLVLSIANKACEIDSGASVPCAVVVALHDA